MANVEIKLLVEKLDGRPVYEMVPAEEIGPARFRIKSSPGFAQGIANGDEIEMTASGVNGYRILRRAGNICVQLFLRTCSQQDRAQISEVIRKVKGWLDGGKDSNEGKSGCLLIYTIPATIGFKAIENVMSEIVTAFDVDRWTYGNVYDTADGHTPLNWWQIK